MKENSVAVDTKKEAVLPLKTQDRPSAEANKELKEAQAEKATVPPSKQQNVRYSKPGVLTSN